MTDEKIYISYKKFNPNFHHLKEALKDDDLRFIFLKGGSSSSKSFSIAQCFLLFCLSHGYNTKVYRKTGASIGDSIYKTFQEAARSLNIYSLFVFTENRITCVNGSYITFSGLDNPEKIKGLESYQFVFCEELNEFEHSDFKQIKKRLRGRPGQKIVSAFNPVSEACWIKTELFDKEVFNDLPTDLYGKLKNQSTGEVLPAEYSTITRKQLNSERYIFNPRKNKEEIHKPDMLIMQSTYLNNFWVVGSPCGTYGFYDRQTIADFEKDKDKDYNYYCIYALGEWGSIRTGGEYLHAFNPTDNCRDVKYDSSLPVHISIDDNLLPYISVTLFQLHGNELKQFHEICAKDPENTASRAGELTSEYLHSIGYKDVVYLYGDSSTKKGNTIDDEKRSFIDKLQEKIEKYYHVENRMPKSNPSVPMSGEFINYLFRESRIMIGHNCKQSITDYSGVKKDANGAILKKKVKNKETGQPYEEFGHITDTLRYVVCTIFKDEYTRFSNKRKHNEVKDNDMKYYNVIPSECRRVLFCYPDINGKFVLFCANVYAGKVYVSDVVFKDGVQDPEEYIKNINPNYCVFECDKSYFFKVRELRSISDIRCSSPGANKLVKISAHQQNINESFYFAENYDEHPDYVEFMNNILDFNGKDSYEAIYALSHASAHIIRNIK